MASELSITYAISSGVKRYESGTATSPAFRAAWTTAMVSSEFGPHHTMRSPCLGAEREQAVREPVHQHVELGEGGGRELRAVAGVDDDGQAVGRAVGVQLQDVGHRGHGGSFCT